MAKELTLQLGERDQQLTVDALKEVLENTLEMLHGLERQFHNAGEPIRWEIIRAVMRSPLTITVVPRSPRGQAKKRVGDKVLNAYVRGLKTLEQGPELPPHFDEDTLEAARKLASVAVKQGTSLKIFAPNEEKVQVDERAVANAQAVAETARRYIDFGTIEGKLEQISTHEADTVSIWETLTNHKIECRVSPEQLQYATTLLRRRVAITGGIRYRNNKPRSIDVEQIRPLREQAELPQPKDIGPVDITGTESPEDYIRRLRDAR